MYKTEQRVIEDVRVGNSTTSNTRFYTGGKSVLELPVTVSFMDEGDYEVHIDSGRVTVKKVDMNC